MHAMPRRPAKTLALLWERVLGESIDGLTKRLARRFWRRSVFFRDRFQVSETLTDRKKVGRGTASEGKDVGQSVTDSIRRNPNVRGDIRRGG